MSYQTKKEPDFEGRNPPLGKITYEEFLAWHDGEVRAEWVNGEVVLLSPNNIGHQTLLKLLLGLFDHFVQAHDAGLVIAAPFQMKTAPNLPGREPDLMFVSREHLDRITETYVSGPADLVVEIISPSSESRDWGQKFAEYREGRVPEVWMLEQPRQEARFLVLKPDGQYDFVPVGRDGIYHSRVLKGFWINVEWLWQDPLPPLMTLLKELKLL